MVMRHSDPAVIDQALVDVEAKLVEIALNKRDMYKTIIELAVTDKCADGAAKSAYADFIRQTGLDWFCPLYCDRIEAAEDGDAIAWKERFGFAFIMGTFVGVADGLFLHNRLALKEFTVQPVGANERGIKVRLCANMLDSDGMTIDVRPSSRGRYASSSAFMVETKKPSVVAGAAAGAFVAGAPGALVGAAIQRDRRREAGLKERELFASAPMVEIPTKASYFDFMLLTPNVFIDENSSKAGDKSINIEFDESARLFPVASRAEFCAVSGIDSNAVVYVSSSNHELLFRTVAGKAFTQHPTIGLKSGDGVFENPTNFCERISASYPLTEIVRPLIAKASDPKWKQARQAQLVLVQYGRDHQMKNWGRLFDVMPSEAVCERLLDSKVGDEELSSILSRCRNLLKKSAQTKKIVKERDEKPRSLSTFDRLRGKNEKIREEYAELIRQQKKVVDDEAKGFVQLRYVVP